MKIAPGASLSKVSWLQILLGSNFTEATEAMADGEQKMPYGYKVTQGHFWPWVGRSTYISKPPIYVISPNVWRSVYIFLLHETLLFFPIDRDKSGKYFLYASMPKSNFMYCRPLIKLKTK